MINLTKNEDNFSKQAKIKSIDVFRNKKDTNFKPFITIAIPTYKRADLLEEALLSAINQNSVNFDYEIIVVDNDFDNQEKTATFLVMEKYKDMANLKYYINEKNLGMGGNWNRCFELAKGEWVALLHDDDLLFSNYLERIYFYLNKNRNNNCHCICTGRETFGKFNKVSLKYSRKLLRKIDEKIKFLVLNKLMKIRIRDNIITDSMCYSAPTCGTIFRKKTVQEIGGFDISGSFVSLDWFFLICFNMKYSVYKTIEPLGYYRLFENESLNITTIIKYVEEKKQIRKFLKEENKLVGYWYKFFQKTYETIAIENAFKSAVRFSKKKEEYAFLEKKYPEFPVKNKFKINSVKLLMLCYMRIKILISIFNG